MWTLKSTIFHKTIIKNNQQQKEIAFNLLYFSLIDFINLVNFSLRDFILINKKQF